MFGGVSWARDSSKVVFIGERVEPAIYKNFWEENDELDAKKRKADINGNQEEEKKSEDKTHYMDEKYLLKDDFGELYNGKKQPTMFVYNLKGNTFDEVQGLDDTLYPSSPMFDEKSEGLVFAGYNLPI